MDGKKDKKPKKEEITKNKKRKNKKKQEEDVPVSSLHTRHHNFLFCTFVLHKYCNNVSMMLHKLSIS